MKPAEFLKSETEQSMFKLMLRYFFLLPSLEILDLNMPNTAGTLHKKSFIRQMFETFSEETYF
jgi:hypothetical protein